MIYLILQISFCLLIAFLLGLVLGWLICRYIHGSEEQKTVVSEKSAVARNHYVPPPASSADSEKSLSSAKKLQEVKEASPKPKPKGTSDSPLKKISSNVKIDGEGYEIETLEGVGPKTGEALRKINIATVSDLLKNAYSTTQREEMAEKISVRSKLVDGWVSMSDLLRIEGIDHQAAELIVASGVKQVSDLADQHAGKLITKMEEANSAGKRSIAPEVPSEKDIMHWSKQASKLNSILKF